MSDLKFEQLRSVVPNVSRETFSRLLAFESLFLKWSKAYNLAAPSTLEHFWQRHILDSAQIFCFKEPRGVWLDIGSGGGLPGVVEAIFMTSREDKDAHGFVHLIESNGKKAAFLRQALLETAGKGCVHCGRIEEISDKIDAVEVVTARALAPLDALLHYAAPWMSRGAVGVFHKGKEFKQEIKVARDVWDFNVLEHKSVIDSSAAVLEITSLKRHSDL